MKGWTPYGLFLVIQVALWHNVILNIYELDPVLQLNTHHKNTWETGMQIHPFVTLALVEVSSQLHAPAALPAKKEPLVPSGEAVWFLEPV
jgi:hypothetical protein